MTRRQRELKMRISFEPTRLSDDFIINAYERISPLAILTNKKSSTTNSDEENTKLTNNEVI